MKKCQSTSASEKNSPEPNSERRSFVWKMGAALTAMLGATAACSSKRETELQKQVEQLTNQLGILEDVHAIRKLQHAYGYYLDKCIYEEVVDLFADDSEVRFNGGIFIGKEKGVRRLYIEKFSEGFTGKKNGPVYGFLLDHLQIQDIVDVAPDRQTAKGRFRTLMQAGASIYSRSGEEAVKKGRPPMLWGEGGIYENEYVRQAGVWKIKVVYYNALWHADYAKGWSYTKPNYVPPFSKIYPDDPRGPDKLMPKRVLWPDTDTIPFHYAHPVTGAPWKGSGD